MNLLCALLLLVAVLGTGAALTRDPRKQVLVFGIYGMALTVLFFALHSPDVAFSEITVSGGVLPTMAVIALRKTRERKA